LIIYFKGKVNNYKIPNNNVNKIIWRRCWVHKYQCTQILNIFNIDGFMKIQRILNSIFKQDL